MIAPRRAFLQGLASLPLIGGSVGIIGNPTAVALPATQQAAFEYQDWLAWEHRRICEELYGAEMAHDAQCCKYFTTNAYRWHRGIRPDLRSREPYWSPPPSSRAALVLSTVGCDWREGYAR